MSLFSILRLFQFNKSFSIPVQYAIQTKNYAAPVGAKKSMKRFGQQPKFVIPVEKDVNKLLTYVCGSNICKEGEDVQLKPDSEYPEWLWNIPTEPPKLSDLDPNTKQYWRYIRKEALRRNNRMQKYRKF